MALLVQPRGALRKELTRYLRSCRMVRRPRAARAANGQGQLRNAVNISVRPPQAADRAVPGHPEGDLLLGRANSAIATLVARTSRVTVRVRLPHGRSSEPGLTALAPMLRETARTVGPVIDLRTRAKSWRCTRSSRSIPACRSTSAIHAAPGSEARTRTRTASSASTSPRAPTSSRSASTNSTPSPRS
jgi:hypothetical protein